MLTNRKVIDLAELSAEIDWCDAETEYRAGEPQRLKELLESEKQIPHQQRKFLADVISGKVILPSKRGKANTNISHSERRYIWDIYRQLKKDCQSHEG